MLRSLLLALTLLAAAAAGPAAAAQDFPPRPDPPRAVNDLADMLGPAEEERLERKLRAYTDTTSAAIVVVTVPTVEPYDIAQYGAQLGQEWGIGQQGLDTGLLLLVARDDRRMNISTGAPQLSSPSAPFREF